MWRRWLQSMPSPRVGPLLLSCFVCKYCTFEVLMASESSHTPLQATSSIFKHIRYSAATDSIWDNHRARPDLGRNDTPVSAGPLPVPGAVR